MKLMTKRSFLPVLLLLASALVLSGCHGVYHYKNYGPPGYYGHGHGGYYGKSHRGHRGHHRGHRGHRGKHW